jgi:EAL domain-containing protein (putative c-di-GMP-specific phosphodiesterase class I)
MAAGFVDTVASVLESTPGEPQLLTLEMTESVFVADGERALFVLNDLKELGVKIALDDFGSGYSSLSYLMRFPVDTIKIDQQFIARLGTEPASRAIVAAITQLAHSLGMTVIAEGVETAEQHRELIELGCDLFQGYFFAQPMAVAALDRLIRDPAGHGSVLPGVHATPADIPVAGQAQAT